MTRMAASASHTPRFSVSRAGNGNPGRKAGGASGGVENVPNLGHRWTRSVGATLRRDERGLRRGDRVPDQDDGRIDAVERLERGP